MHGVERFPGPQLTKTSLITAIPHHQRRIICSQLDVFDKWKRFVGHISGRDGAPRYTDLHMCLFDREKERRHGSPTEAVLNDWRTLRPTIGEFIEVLLIGELVAVADYIHNEVLKLGRLREPREHNETEVGGNFLPHRPPPSFSSTLGSFAPQDERLSLQYQEHNYTSILDQETMASLTVMMSQQVEPIPFYSYRDLEVCTNDFDKVHLNDGGRFLGKGGYGEVYFGKTCIDGKIEMLAVKRFHESSLEYLKQFKTELEVIFMNCHHPNLLTIKGICHEKSFCVIYEYMKSGTLEQNLRSISDPDAESVHLSSERRLQIAVDVAKGISRLHKGGESPIVHRDIKPANILLDHEMNAKVGDYGLIRVQTLQDSSYTNKTSDVHGSSDYMPPEAQQGTVSPKWDVYSFGVVLLELLFAKGPVHRDADGYNVKMIEYIFDGDFEGDPLSLLDPRCDWKEDVATQILALVHQCALKWRRRPSISGDDTAVLETLLRIQKDAQQLLR